LIPEDIRRNIRDGTSSKEVEEDFSLASKKKKAKGKKSQGEEGRKNMALMKVKCFHCHEHMHYAKNCPQKKASKKKPTITTIAEDITSQFELHFILIACMADIVMGGMWYLHNGASFHMTRNRYLFSDFEKKDLKQSIEFGDDERYIVLKMNHIGCFEMRRQNFSHVIVSERICYY